MSQPELGPSEDRASSRRGLFRRLSHGLLVLVQFALLLWATLAIFYSNLPWDWARFVLAVAFAAFSIWALWLSGRSRLQWVFAMLFLGVLAWFISIQPSHDREWRPEVAVMPRAIIDGDRVRLTGYRNFDYRTRDDFTPRWEEREVSLAELKAVDLFISYWRVGPVGHTFVSFRFETGPPVCISIETRPEVGEGFDPLASLFKQFELYYAVGDERDIVRVRTNYRDEEVYLYPLLTPPEGARRLFRVYLDRINELADRAEFYHLLSSSCTINIVRYANLAGREGRWDFRHYLNGYADRYLYRAGIVDTTLPFPELRRRSRINDAARAADQDPDFWRRIREGLPGAPAQPEPPA